MSKNVLIQHI